MNPEVIKFIQTLDRRMRPKFTLELIALRIQSVSNHYTYTDAPDKKEEHRETLQQLMDLYQHVFNGKPAHSFHSPIILLEDYEDFFER